MISQVVIVYAMSAFWKLGGKLWQEVTALYFIGSLEEFRFVAIPDWLLHNGLLVTAQTYGVVVIQGLVAALALLPRRIVLRLMVTAAAITMHLGIALGMGLVQFGFTMIAADLLLLSNSDWSRLATLPSLLSKRERKGRELSQPSPVIPIAQSGYTPCYERHDV